METIAQILIDSDPRELDLEFNEMDLAYELPGEGRFRVNISRQRHFHNIVLRVIPLDIKESDELNLPEDDRKNEQRFRRVR